MFFLFTEEYYVMLLFQIGSWTRLCAKKHIAQNVYQRNFVGIVTPFARKFSSKFYDSDDDIPSVSKYRQNSQPQRFGYNARSDRPTRAFNNDRGGYSNYNNQRNSNSYGAQRSRNSSFGQLRKPDWQNAELGEINKNLYQPHETTLSRSEEEIKQFYDEHEINVPRGAPKPILTSEELQGLPGKVLEEMKKKNFHTFTPIQAQAWPIALSGHNMVGIAQTG